LKLNAPISMPSGSNGFSSGGGRRLGGVVAMVAVTRPGPAGGAPGRFWLRVLPASGAAAGCSCAGVAAGAWVFADAVSAFCWEPRSGALPGFGLAPRLALRFGALLESKPVVPAPTAGR
jgi:hypothetical protein